MRAAVETETDRIRNRVMGLASCILSTAKDLDIVVDNSNCNVKPPYI